MNMLHRLGVWLSRLNPFAKGVGDRVWSRILSIGSGVWGAPGSWSQDRRLQAAAYTGWTYVGVRAICEGFAGLPIQAAYRRDPDAIPEAKRKAWRASGRLMDGRARRKSLAVAQPHEELELLPSDHPLVRLLNNPNKPDTGWTFRYRLMLNLELTGNAYVWAIPNALGEPAELWVLPSHWVWPSPIRDKDELVSWWEIRPYGVATSGGSFKIPAEEVVHLAYPHPMTPMDGFSPSAAGAAWLDIATAMDTSRWAAMQEGIRPGLVLKMDGNVANPDKETAERILSEIEARHKGPANNRRPILLGPGVDTADDHSRTPAEMDFHQGSEQMRDWVLALRRVSKTIAGLDDSANFATMHASAANFARWTLRPKCEFVDSILTEKLAKRFDDDLIVYHDDPTPNDPQQRNADIALRAQHGAITPNEIRREFGDEPYEHGGDDPLLSPSVVPVPWATGEDGDAQAFAEALAAMQEAKQPAPSPADLAGALGGGGERPGPGDGEPPQDGAEKSPRAPKGMGEARFKGGWRVASPNGNGTH